MKREDIGHQIIDALREGNKSARVSHMVTLTLPTYAPGDPKAGQVVGRYDVIFDDQRECDMDSLIGVLARPDGSVAYLMESAEGFDGPLYTQRAPMKFYSTPAARDAACAADAQKEADHA